MKNISLKMTDNFKISLLSRENIYELENNASLLSIECDVKPELEYKLHIQHKDTKNLMIMDKGEDGISKMLTAEYFPEDGTYYIQLEGSNPETGYRIESNKIRLEIGSFINAENIPAPMGGSAYDDVIIHIRRIERDISSLRDSKQDKLIAGENITISGNVISATAKGYEYTAGDNINISEDNVISAIIPTKTSELTNDSGYISESEVSSLIEIETNARSEADSQLESQISDVNTKLDTKQDKSAMSDYAKTADLSELSTNFESEVQARIDGDWYISKVDTNKQTVTVYDNEMSYTDWANYYLEHPKTILSYNGWYYLPFTKPSSIWFMPFFAFDTTGDSIVLTYSNGTFTRQNIATANKVEGVKINGVSILDSNKVANIPLASDSKLGVVKANSEYGVYVNQTSGLLILAPASESYISAKTNNYKPITPKTVDYAVKSGLAYSKIAWTDTEKASARERLGITEGGDVTKEYLEENYYDKTYCDGEISDINDRIDDLKLFKFPNVTIIGTPTINHGQISDFSNSSYLKFPFLVDFRNHSFEIKMAFTTGTNVTSQENIFDSDFGLAFAIRSGKFVIAVSTNGTNWDLGEGVGTYSVQPNTTYYVRLGWDLTNYYLSYSLDGSVFINDINKAGTAQPYPKQIFIGVGENFTTVVNHFTGTINLNHATLQIGDEIVWSGMDDAGLSTRADVSLSNIDEAGEEKIKSVAGSVDIQINSTSIVQDGVANVIMRPVDYGVDYNQSTKTIQLKPADEGNIRTRNGNYRPICSNKILDYAVKQAMCDGKGAEWTDEEKTMAQIRMGILSSEGVLF